MGEATKENLARRRSSYPGKEKLLFFREAVSFSGNCGPDARLAAEPFPPGEIPSPVRPPTVMAVISG